MEVDVDVEAVDDVEVLPAEVDVEGVDELLLDVVGVVDVDSVDEVVDELVEDSVGAEVLVGDEMLVEGVDDADELPSDVFEVLALDVD